MANNITQLKQPKDINIGIVIFLVILIYIIGHFYNYISKSEISIYEVQPGEIYTTAQCDGMIIRKEELVLTEVAGYVNYYFSEGSRVAKDSTIYSIDSNRNIYELISGNTTEIKLSGDDLSDFKFLLQENLINTKSHHDIATAKANVLTSYQRLIDTMLMQELNQIMASTGITSNFHIVTTKKSGIISYAMDDYTNYTAQEVMPECFDKKDTISLYSIDLIAANSPVYKIITDDTWNIVVKLDDVLYGYLFGKETATFTLNNELTVTAPITCYRKNDAYFAEITMDKYLSNFSSERFVRIKFEVTHVNGLKIPETSITWKDYYRIPEEYLIEKEIKDSKKKGLYVEVFNLETGTTEYEFQEITIFYSNEGFFYVDCSDLSKDIYITTSDKSNRVMLYTFVNKLEGAYNINKGYAVFKRIERLNTENGYSIIKKNSISGLSTYDHIALDATSVIEDAVIY